MRAWYEAIRTGLRAYTQNIYYDNFCYLYGAKGRRLENPEIIKEYFQMYPEYYARYNYEEKEQIIKNSLLKIAYDCSGFVGWLCTGDCQYSTGQIANSHDKTTDLAAGPAGSILYTTYNGSGRHIGLDIGYGYCLDMAYESTDRFIKEHKAGIRLYKITDGVTKWEVSGQSNVLDYTGSDAR